MEQQSAMPNPEFCDHATEYIVLGNYTVLDVGCIYNLQHGHDRVASDEGTTLHSAPYIKSLFKDINSSFLFHI